MNLDAVETVADFPEVFYIQPMQEAITQQEETVQVRTANF